MLNDIVKNLEKGKYLLEMINNEQYTDKTMAPYHSSIGGHIRHILDMFYCVFKGFESGSIIDLTHRKRDLNTESDTSYGIEYFNFIIHKINHVDVADLEINITMVDDLGSGNCVVRSTFGSALAQAQSHAIHHYATIGYIMHSIGVTLPVDNFGVNPTTPK